MIILDTNVLSALMLRSPDMVVAAWLDRQPQISIWTTSITIMEIRIGLQVMPAGKRKGVLMQTFEVVQRRLQGRIAPFDEPAASQAADLIAQRRQRGRPGDLRDSMVAGIVLDRGATFATRNIRHFDDLAFPVVNPWKEPV